MQRLLQALLFITIISAAFASIALSTGCNKGKIWTTKYDSDCLRCECVNNKSHCRQVLAPCKAEGSYSEFHTFEPAIEPPKGIYVEPTDDPKYPWAEITQTSPDRETVGTKPYHGLLVENRELPEPQK